MIEDCEHMASVDFEALKTALSDEAPCGPDLDMDFDDDYMNFVTNLEGLLPTTFFNDGVPFTLDPATIDVDWQRNKCIELLNRSRDLRLTVQLARLYILDRDLANFALTVDVMASLLDRFWGQVHPQAEGGQLAMRSAILSVLDEPTVVFSMQYCRICETRRQGPVTFRSYLYATREAEPRAGEEIPNEGTLVQSMRDSEEQIAATRARLQLLHDSLQRIATTWAANGDVMSGPKLSSIMGITKRIFGLLELAFPTNVSLAVQAEGTEDDTQSTGSSRVGSSSDAMSALTASIGYFKSREPSSPVLPLIVQAQQLIGKSFPEILQALLPDQMSSASFQIGGRQVFDLPLERLPTYDTTPDEAPEASDPGEGTDGEVPDQGEAQAVTLTTSFKAETRNQALSLLDDVSSYLKTSEPGSPIPWLIERARALAERDFLSILRAILPASALRDLDEN